MSNRFNTAHTVDFKQPPCRSEEPFNTLDTLEFGDPPDENESPSEGYVKLRAHLWPHPLSSDLCSEPI